MRELEAEEKVWAQQTAEKIKKKMILVAERSRDKIPYTTENGVHDDQTQKNICWWTNGFWGGMMWQLYVATAHADTARKYFVREDGSVNHIVEFDALTGEFVQTFGGQGVEVGSLWTRGQAWALYGFVLSYLHTEQ